ncbi:MAG: glutamine-hydrolyzing carbamoyl-phosphate synthase small subunit [Deltaproteobacteria bacterium]|nr:glutamine-hydrolyzing carbamoyl-phosphate synthase small subunit [Deltaproteobacteria bacterium]
MAGGVKDRFKEPDGVLWLEDGSEFEGCLFGAAPFCDTPAKTRGFGEVIFNTAMSGYQEVLTDTSYWQQIVVMTYPHQGNYGVNETDDESHGGPKVSGFIVRENVPIPSNFSSKRALEDDLRKNGIPALTGVDTRALTLHIRDKGAMRGLILSKEDRKRLGKDAAAVFAKYPSFLGRDLIKEVTTKRPYWFSERGKKTVVAIDFGIKLGLLREIAARGASVVVLPATATAEEILAYKPDGVFLSNGPGDPATATYAIKTVRELLGKKPIFGVCMGHQILSLALGGKTYKMKFGHRGVNQPVLNVEKKSVEISSHNHGFAVDADSLPKNVRQTHVNLNDRTCEGIDCPELNAFSVQYHPESAPGPHDSDYLFDKFVKAMG